MRYPAAATDLTQKHPDRGRRVEVEPSVARSSFYAAMRLLPAKQRRAMFAIYRFCRAVDDIADSRSAQQTRLTELESWRRDVDALFAGKAPSRLQSLLEPIRDFDLQCADFLSIIDGMEMDARADIRAPALATLDLYCDRVACAVGRLSVRVFGIPAPAGAALANHLGRALQLTNILRDLDEDARTGRLYLPREALLAAGISQTEPAAVLDHPALSTACESLADRARGHFARAREIMAAQPRRSVRAPRLMAKVYENILERLVERGWVPPRRPIRVGRGRIAWIVLRDGLSLFV